MGFWPFNRKAREHSDALRLAVAAEQPVQASWGKEPPDWVKTLIRFLVAKWPSLVSLLMLILEIGTDKMSPMDRLDAMQGLNKYRRYVSGSMEKVAESLEAAS